MAVAHSDIVSAAASAAASLAAAAHVDLMLFQPSTLPCIRLPTGLNAATAAAVAAASDVDFGAGHAPHPPLHLTPNRT